MAICGKCHQAGQTVEHIRACYAGTAVVAPVVTAAAFQPMALAPKAVTVPESKYAVTGHNDQVVFYEVKKPSKGKWAGYTFVDRLVGHPGDFLRYAVKGQAKATVLAQIAEDAKAAAFRFSQEFTVCACCGSPLSDPESLATGFGPVCIKRFAA